MQYVNSIKNCQETKSATMKNASLKKFEMF